MYTSTTMRSLIGLVIIVLGLGLFLERLGVPGASYVLDGWWPFVVIAVGVLIWSGNRRQWFVPAVIVLFGLLMALDRFSFVTSSVWEMFWPAIVILVGVRIVYGKSWSNRAVADNGPASATVLFSGLERRVTGKLTESDISAWFGGAKLDLRQAEFSPSATLRVTAGFGGIEIFVPTSVKIVSHISGIFGGTDDKTTATPNATNTLTLTGTALFGGVSIKN